ncbi:MAG: hypothetical protein ABSA12_14805 [Verrucomicrobiia bacterium]
MNNAASNNEPASDISVCVSSIEAIVDKAKRDDRVRPLLDRLEKQCKIEYCLSRTGIWYFDLDLEVIGCADTPNPGAALAHELLHLEMKVRGCRSLYYIVPKTEPGLALNFRNCLNNELQHHKMYPEFIALGFQGDEFYGSEEPDTPNTGEPAIDIAIMYFSAIAPGGSLPEEQRRVDEDRILQEGNGQYRDGLLKIREAVEDWKNSSNYDIEPTVRRIWRAIEKSSAWFGYLESDRPPAQGFFAGEAFDFIDEYHGLVFKS